MWLAFRVYHHASQEQNKPQFYDHVYLLATYRLCIPLKQAMLRVLSWLAIIFLFYSALLLALIHNIPQHIFSIWISFHSLNFIIYSSKFHKFNQNFSTVS